MKSGGHKNVRRTEETKCAFDVVQLGRTFLHSFDTSKSSKSSQWIERTKKISYSLVI